MRYAVIDVGSNSVRLMFSDGINTEKKLVKTTRLAENMGEERFLKSEPIKRTIQAIYSFIELAKLNKVDQIFAFATAAVRQAINGKDFVDIVKSECDIDLEVISGDKEALIGFLGALSGKDGGIIDVGGASTEVVVSNFNNIIFEKSIPIGAVKITDLCGQDSTLAERVVVNKINELGNIPIADFYAIGGTATSIAAILQELEPYDPVKIDGYKLSVEELQVVTDKLYSLSVAERKTLKGLQPERAEVIANGAKILLSVTKKIGIEKIIVSEKDNLEGYLTYKLERK